MSAPRSTVTALGVLGACALLLLGGCGGKAEKDFMAGCMNSGASKSVCSCIYQELKEDLATGQDEPTYLQSSVFRARRPRLQRGISSFSQCPRR